MTPSQQDRQERRLADGTYTNGSAGAAEFDETMLEPVDVPPPVDDWVDDLASEFLTATVALRQARTAFAAAIPFDVSIESYLAFRSQFEGSHADASTLLTEFGVRGATAVRLVTTLDEALEVASRRPSVPVDDFLRLRSTVRTFDRARDVMDSDAKIADYIEQRGKYRLVPPQNLHARAISDAVAELERRFESRWDHRGVTGDGLEVRAGTVAYDDHALVLAEGPDADGNIFVSRYDVVLDESEAHYNLTVSNRTMPRRELLHNLPRAHMFDRPDAEHSTTPIEASSLRSFKPEEWLADFGPRTPNVTGSARWNARSDRAPDRAERHWHLVRLRRNDCRARQGDRNAERSGQHVPRETTAATATHARPGATRSAGQPNVARRPKYS